MTHHDPVLTSTKPRLVILKGPQGSPALSLEPAQLQALRTVFEVVEVHSPEAAKKVLDGAIGGMVIGAPSECLNVTPDRLPTAAHVILERIGDGIGVVDAIGSLMWTDARFKVHDEHCRSEFVAHCKQALDLFNQPASPAVPDRRRAKRFSFVNDNAHYELIVCPASLDQTQDKVTSVVGVLWDITAACQMQERLLQIDRAGESLLRIQPASATNSSMADRLKLLESKIGAAMRDILHFENFEVRLLDRESSQLELVISRNIPPLKVGEVMHLGAEGQGISGYVAATGKSYVCPDVQADSRYREGLENASSSLTVPLMLDDRVVGTLNVESCTTAAFTETDRILAERFGRYIAGAMNVLDLLVIERFTTNEQVTANVIGELNKPLSDMTNQVKALRDRRLQDTDTVTAAEQLLQTIARLSDRMHACTSGPRTILGAEQELHRHEPDPLLVGKRVLVADDEPAIRDTLNAILTQKGATVTVCDSGAKTINAIEDAYRTGVGGFDLIISDIKMPDRNGYEVYRIAKTANPDTPVVLMTGFGYDPHHSIVRASQEGLQSFLFKPFKVSQLMEVLNRSLAKK